MSGPLVRGGAMLFQGAGRRLLVAPVQPLRPQLATIVSKAMRDKDYKRPVPFPYKRSPYGFLAALVDRTKHRFDENSKVVVVDGPVAAGKTKFAKELADELDMLYMPDANMDSVYINSYGFDMRQLDHKLPDSCKSFDEKDFLACPSHPNAPNFQFEMLRLRVIQYMDALAHILNTGQGVVMDRCVYSDFVFAETMFKFGYMRKEVLEVYDIIKDNTLPELLRPHLVIYLDVPVGEVHRRVQARPPPHPNSPWHKPEVFECMDEILKQKYLKQISNHAELLIYDWSDQGDSEVVVEDIERLDLDKYGYNDTKMQDWLITKEIDWTQKRILYSIEKDSILSNLNVPCFNVKELIVDAHDVEIFQHVWNNAPGNKFAEGYNADQGDQITFKVGP